ncbi:MAG: septum formation initiator family protein [Acidobacteriota bacterium]|nr:septum formation initiator family protein [Acidobacteriota bacterium]
MSTRDDEQKNAPPARFNRRLIPMALVGLFLAGSLSAIFGDDGYLELGRLRRACRNVQGELDRQEVRNATLARDIQRLQNEPSARERIARERLGYGRDGEVQFLLPRAARSGTDHAPTAARPLGPSALRGNP